MSLNFELINDAERASITKKVSRFPEASNAALNRTIKKVFTLGSRLARQRYKIGKEDLDKRLRIDYSRLGELKAAIRGTRRPFSMGRFAVKKPQTRTSAMTGNQVFVQPSTLYVEIIRGRRSTASNTFWAWAKQGKEGKRPALFRRVGKERTPIEFRYAIGAEVMFYRREHIPQLQQFAAKDLKVELDRQIISWYNRP